MAVLETLNINSGNILRATGKYAEAKKFASIASRRN